MARTDAPESGPTGAIHPVVAVALVLVAAQLAFRAWALSRSWFYTDDFLRLQEAARADVGLDFLLRPDNGHVMPGTRLVHLVFAHGPGLDWTAAAAVALVFQAMASLAALWMLVTLFGPKWGVLPPLVLYLSSAMTAQAALWWISALNQTPVQMSFFLSVGCFVAYLRRRTLLPLLGVLGSVAWGLLFFQKVLYVLPVLALVALAYFADGWVVTRVRTVVSRYWPAAVVVGVPAAAYTWAYLRLVHESTVDRTVDWLALTSTMLTMFAAGVSGGPLQWTDRPGGAWANPPAWVVVAAWLVVAATVLSSMVLRRRAGRAWTILLLYYVMLVGTIAVTRATVFGDQIGAAYRLQTDGLCAAVLALGLAWLPLPGAEESSEPRRRAASLARRRLRRWWRPDLLPAVLTAALVGLVAVGGTVSWVRYTHSWTRINDARPFVEGISRESARLPGVEVVDREVPESVLDDLTRPHNKLSDISDLIAPDLRFPTVSGRLTVVDDRGGIHQALILRRARTREGPVPECGWPVPHDELVRVPLRVPAPYEPRWLRIGYYVQDAGEVTVAVGDRELTTTVGSGPNSLYIRVTEPIDGVRFSDLTSRGALCVNIIEVGQPVAGPAL